MNVTDEQWADVASVLPGDWTRGEDGYIDKAPVWIHKRGYILEPPLPACDCGNNAGNVYWTARDSYGFDSYEGTYRLGLDPADALRDLRGALERHAEMLAAFAPAKNNGGE